MERNEKVKTVPEHPIRTKLFVVATTMVLLGAVLTAVTLGIFGSAPVLATILGDGTAPTTTLTITPWEAEANNHSGQWGHTEWYTQNVTMNLTATAGGADLLANISYRINGGAWLNYSNATIVGMNVTLNQTMVGPDGNITIDYRSTDAGNDMEIYNTNVTWIDTEAPTVSVVATVGTAGSNGWYTSADVTVKLVVADNVDGSGVNTTYYTNGTEATKAVLCNETLPTLVMSGQGIHNLTAAAKDNATNNGTIANLAVKIDSVAPTLALTNASGTISENKTTLVWTASDATSGIDHYEVKVGSGAFVAVGNVLSYQVTKLADGNNTVVVKAVDKAGNSVDKTIYLTVNKPASDMTMILIIVAIIVVIVIVAVVMMKRKGKSPVDAAAPEEEKPSN
jgi:uncharacterized membrane protein